MIHKLSLELVLTQDGAFIYIQYQVIVQFFKSPARIFIPIILGLYIINLGRIDTCTILNIPIHESGMSLHLFRPSFMPLKRNLNILSTKAKCIFVSVISWTLYIFIAIINILFFYFNFYSVC